MKRTLSFMLALALAVSVFVSAAPAASAAGVSNSIKGSYTSAESDNSYAKEQLNRYDRKNEVQRPKNGSYLDCAEHMYVNAPKGHSIFAYSAPSSKSAKQDDVYHGSSISVLAYENGWACITYVNHKLEACAGWVDPDMLSSRYPGDYVSFGSPLHRSGDCFGSIPEQSISNNYFVDTDCKYLNLNLLWPDAKDCFGIELNYQVISRNGVKDASGERTVYINDGSGWEEVGSFDVDKDLSPVRISIYYGWYRSIQAVAVIPSNSAQEQCLVRQSVEYMYFPMSSLEA